MLLDVSLRDALDGGQIHNTSSSTLSLSWRGVKRSGGNLMYMYSTALVQVSSIDVLYEDMGEGEEDCERVLCTAHLLLVLHLLLLLLYLLLWTVGFHHCIDWGQRRSTNMDLAGICSLARGSDEPIAA